MARRADVVKPAGRGSSGRRTAPPYPRQAGGLSLRFAPDRIPDAPGRFVTRPRLDGLLDEALQRPLTVLVAPAGSGKTVTLAHWAAGLSASVAWVDAALCSAAELRRLIRHASSGAPDVVVIDDAHLLDAAAWAAIDTWLTSRAADEVRLVISSRRDVPFGLVSLELTDAVRVLRSDTLRFDDGEARALVRAHAPDVADEDVVALQGRAQGWAAALVLGARALAGAGDRAEARGALARTDRPVLDYLLGEIFETLPPASQLVLLCTSGVRLITEDSAVVLSGDVDAATRLAELAAEGFLVTTYRTSGGDAAHAWRYHPLLHELLRRQVAVDGPAHELYLEAQRRAACHYATHGPTELAVRHAALAGDERLLVDLLVNEGPALVSAGQEAVLAEALDRLPPGAAEREPTLLGVMALVQRERGDAETTARLCAQAIAAAATVTAARDSTEIADGTTAALVADAALLETWQARLGWSDLNAAVQRARSVLGCTHVDGPADHEPTGPLAPARSIALLNELTAAETWLAELDVAAAHNAEALVAAQTLGHDRLLTAAYANRAVLELLAGRPQAARGSASLVRATADRSGHVRDTAVARAQIVLAWSAFYEWDLAGARDALLYVPREGGAATDPLVSTLALILDARLRAEAGDVDAAAAMIAHVGSAPQALPPYLIHMLALVRAQWAMQLKDRDEAHAQIALLAAAGAPESAMLVDALLHVEAADDDEALRLLNSVLVSGRGTRLGVVAAYAASARLRLRLRQGMDRWAAREVLCDVLNRTAQQHLVHVFGFPGPMTKELAQLIRTEARRADGHPFAPDVLIALERHPRRTETAQVGAGTFEVNLTGRETDVLRELSLGGSYGDIAQALFVTENTVKTHVASLYRKLGADRRGEALRRAREIELL